MEYSWKEVYMIIIDILIIILIFILALLLLILFVPFCYSIRLTNNENCFYYGARVRWLFGLFQLAYNNKRLFHVRLFGIPVKIKKKRDKEKAEMKEKNKEIQEKNKKKRKVTRKGIKYLVECLKNIIRKYMPKKIDISGQLGFEDPSITGLAQGLANALGLPMNMKNVEFIYNDEVYSGKIYISGSVAVYYLVFTFLKLILYKPTRLMIK